MTAQTLFQHALSSARLGVGHESLASVRAAVRGADDVPTEFSLVVVLSPNAHSFACDDDGDTRGSSSSNISILLGKKLRGFGKGFYNCFGGKLEKGEHNHPAKGAVRELEEETGIVVELSLMEDSFVGNINFTFEDSGVNKATRVHLFCIFISLSSEPSLKQQYPQTTVMVDPKHIRGCDEIEPKWFHNIYDIPLNQMFADDSLWLTMILKHYNVGVSMTPPNKLMFDAWFHFHPGGQETNTIMHHFVQINDKSNITSKSTPKTYTLEKRLFHAMHNKNGVRMKEFKGTFWMWQVGISFNIEGYSLVVHKTFCNLFCQRKLGNGQRCSEIHER